MKNEQPKCFFEPILGSVYRNRNGSDYLCKEIHTGGAVVMERVSDGWQLEAHGLKIYPNGEIEWDYSSGGHWTK